MEDLSKMKEKYLYLIGKEISGMGKITSIIIASKDESKLNLSIDSFGQIVSPDNEKYNDSELTLYAIFSGYGSNNIAFYNLKDLIEEYNL